MFHSKQLLRVFALAAAVLLFSTVSFVQANDDVTPDRPIPDYVTNLMMDAQATGTLDQVNIGKLEGDLIGAVGTQRVIVVLNGETVAQVAAQSSMSPQAQASQASAIRTQQTAVMNAALGLDSDMRVLGRTKNLLNAVFMTIDAAALADLASNENVAAIHLVRDYELDLTETVPYIGGTAVQDSGFDGSGVTVAVLDSGVDYAHANLGGGGTLADYEAAYGTDPSDPRNTTLDGLFPTAKVVGGFDFVGEDWPNTPEAFDPDPIDFQGHGTNVADIIGGVNGVAPGADIVAVKVCSAVATSCSGLALALGMDFSVDPNGDGNLDDAVDIINMSLGSDYGTAFDDDLSFAVENATAVGTLTVSSAGNGGDNPYKVGTPSSAPTALSVAQTTVPSAFQPLMTVTSPESIAGDYLATFQSWSVAPTGVISGSVQYGDGAGGNLNGCAPFDAGSLDGLVVLVDRGACTFTLKISNISVAGGKVGIIGLIDGSAPFNGGDGGDRPIDIPGYMISQATSNLVKSELAAGVEVTFDPSSGDSLAMHVVGSSSRGPALGSTLIKPEIGAPGASLSAAVGTGTGERVFGGTSGASPMVAGSAALLMEAYPDRSWAEIKAVLMNNGETDIINEYVQGGGELAPITRIGGGEVRVDRALNSPIAAWDSEDLTGALSFGFHDVRERWTKMEKYVTVANYTDETVRYKVTSSFRYANDEATNGVSLYHPSRVVVPPNGTVEFKVTMVIRGNRLHDWVFNAGSLFNNSGALTLNEYDGYIHLDNLQTTDDDENPPHLAWHVLPRKASLVLDNQYLEDGPIQLANRGFGTASLESYSLVGTSGDLPPAVEGGQLPVNDLRYAGFATYPVPAGFCSGNESFILALAVNTWEPADNLLFQNSYNFFLDVDQDGTDDYNIFNGDLGFYGGGAIDGRSVTWVFDLATGAGSAFFFTDSNTNSGNTVLLLCGEQIGMNAANFFQPIDMDLFGVDLYYTGIATDAILDMVIAPLGEEYLGVFDDFTSIGFTDIPGKTTEEMVVFQTGLGITTETGLLIMDRNGSEREVFTIPAP